MPPLLLIKLGVTITFLPELASILKPPNLWLPNSWDYRHESLCPAHITSLHFIIISDFEIISLYYIDMVEKPYYDRLLCLSPQ
jgi:hypothetical protein